jgi:hypothetical protein
LTNEILTDGSFTFFTIGATGVTISEGAEVVGVEVVGADEVDEGEEDLANESLTIHGTTIITLIKRKFIKVKVNRRLRLLSFKVDNLLLNGSISNMYGSV